MKRIVALAAVSILFGWEVSWEARAEAPTAEVAKKCLHFSYIAYPYKVPGKVHASPDRQNYFKACIEKNGDIPQPVRPKA